MAVAVGDDDENDDDHDDYEDETKHNDNEGWRNDEDDG